MTILMQTFTVILNVRWNWEQFSDTLDNGGGSAVDSSYDSHQD